MIQENEDDRLDQSLRDTFSDFDLPPSGHVWSGVEGRLSGQSGPPRQVPLLLLLPAVALVGVAVGWLLPHPATAPATPPPPRPVQVLAKPASRPSQPSAASALAYATTPAAQALRRVAEITTGQPQRLAAGASLGATAPYQAARAQLNSADATGVDAGKTPVPQEPGIAASRTTNAEVLPEAVQPTVSAPALLTQPPQNTAEASASGEYAASLPTLSSREESRQEWRPEYRMPKHRLAERGLRLRRFRTTITRQWQHLFGPRRTRTAQPTS